MNRTLMEWRHFAARRRQGRICMAAAASAAVVWSMAIVAIPRAASAAPAAAAAQPAEVDAASKLLLKASGLFNRGMFKLAAADYETFLQQYPNHPDATTARYALAICQYRQNEFEPAIALLNTVLKDAKFEQRDEALAVLGHSQLSTGHYDEALATFDQLLSKYPKSKHAETAALNKAQVLYLAKKYPDAATAAAAFLKRYPDSEQRPAALYFLALSQKAQDQNDRSAATLQTLLDQFPKSRFELDATLLLGQSLEAQNKLDAAADAYRKFIAMAPAARAADGHYSLGVVLSRQGKLDDAATELSAVVSGGDSPYVRPAKLQLGLVQLSANKTSAARKTLADVLKNDPARANDAKYGLAQVDLAEKQYKSALSTLDELAKLDPPPANAPQIALDRAVCLAELGQHQEAASAFADFIEKHPQSPQLAEALYREAFSQHKLGHYDASHALCKRAAAMKSDYTEPSIELDAENLFLLGDYAQATPAYEALAARAKDADRKARIAFRLGQCAYFSKDYAKAAALLEPIASNAKWASDEALGRAGLLLGDALLQQGKFADAAAALQKYLPQAKTDKAEVQFKLALAQLRSDQPDAAKQNLKVVAAGNADSQWTQRADLELGQLLYKQEPEQASAALKKVLAANPPEELAAPATYLLGWIHFDAKEFDDAADAWQQVTTNYAKNPLAADAAFQRGVALREAGKNEQALAALQAYVKDYPQAKNVAQAKQRLAGVLSSLHRDDQAKALLTALAADKSASNEAVLYDLAWAQKGTKDSGGAIETYRRLLKDYPDGKLIPAAKTELAELLYADKKYDDAAALLDSVIQKKDADPKPEPKVLSAARYLLGWCYQKQDKPADAAAAFTAYAQGAAGNATGEDADRLASALLQAGIAYAAHGQFDSAAKPLAEMLAKFPDHKDAPIAMLKLGEVQADAGLFDASLKTYQQFLAKYASDPLAYRAHFGAGWALENLKKFPEARAAYAKVIASNNGETAARAQFQTGETFLDEQKFEPAIPALLAVEDVYAYPKWSAKALLEAGNAFQQLKQSDQAKQQYTQLVTKYKDAPEAELAKERLKTLNGS